jgi:type I restriction-modification system DNA methylase subunit
LITVLNIIQKEIQMNEILRRALELKFNIILKEMKEQKGALIIGMKSEEIKKLIEDNLTIKKEEKDKFGEVFTPPALINEMLDRLPTEVWSNPDLKWLDPANGIGNFPMIVYERLIKELPSNYKNSKGDGYNDLHSKQKWILENMLYMVELNPKNVKISKKIFGDNANIYCGDFLTMDMKKESGIEKFDIIIGNPPFQGNGRKKGIYYL